MVVPLFEVALGRGDGGAGTCRTECVMYSSLCPCYEIYSERGGKKKTGAAEMACYPKDLCFDGDERVGGRRGAGGVYS